MQTQFKENTFIINGRKFYYWEKNEMQKPVIVFLHGFPGNHEGMMSLAGNITGYRLIIPDLPACGQSEPLVGQYNLKNYATWLNNFFEALFIEKAIIVGHSFGARVALMFSNSYSEKSIKLVLITPVVKVEGFVARLVFLYYRIAEVLPEYLQKIVLSNGFGKKLGDMVIFKSANPKLQKEIIARDIVEIKKINQQVIIDLFNDFYSSKLTLVTKINGQNVLVIAGDLDEIAPLNSVKELASQLPGAKLEVLEKAGHLVPLERPLDIANIIEEWLGDYPK